MIKYVIRSSRRLGPAVHMWKRWRSTIFYNTLQLFA